MGIRPARARGVRAAAPENESELLSGGARVHAELEGGNLGSAEWVSPAHLRFTARADRSPKPLWFYFCLEGARVPSVVCELTNADECFGPRLAWSNARPVYSPDGRAWRRVERASYVSPVVGAGAFQFSVPIVGPVTHVAYCLPYTTADLSALLAAVRARPGLALAACGETAEGRPVPYLRFGNPARGLPAVWVLARQHAGETPASWVVDGLVRHLAAHPVPDLPGSIHLIPMVDPDGVSAGRYGKDETPVDSNRDWSPLPARSETAAILQAMRAAHGPNPTALVLDIHASHHGDTECYLFGEPQGRTACRQRQLRFVERLAHYGPPAIGLRSTDLRFAPAPLGSARGFLARQFGCPALTFEVSYHLTQTGRYPNAQDYRELGAAVAQALVALLSPAE